jgi:hypothetical protein
MAERRPDTYTYDSSGNDDDNVRSQQRQQQRRLFVGDLPLNCTQADVIALIDKTGLQVVDTHFPSPVTPTGISRNFAVVRCVGDDKKFEQCIKVLNNCFWKNGRIRVEAAKQYYRDRLRAELDTLNVGNNTVIEKRAGLEAPSQNAPIFSGASVRLRRRRLQPAYTVSTVPFILGRDPNGTTQKTPSCRKLYFDVDGNAELQLPSVMLVHTSGILGSVGQPSTTEQATAKVTLKSSGVRRGFGTISLATFAARCDSCVENLPATADDSIETENVPCMTPEELASESLAAERDRYKRMIGNIFGGVPAVTGTVVAPSSHLNVTCDDQSSANQFANLNEFKSIFFKQV